MELQTKVNIDIEGGVIDYNSKIFMVGSCFSTNIGKQLSSRKFDVLYNPLGTIYNPISIANTLSILRSNEQITEQDLFFKNEQWGHFSFNTEFSSENKTGALFAMNKAVESGRRHLQNSNIIIITLGTSYCYRYKLSGDIVSNCHKLKSDSFIRELLSVDDIINSLSAILDDEFYRAKRVIFTVSPIRHLKDGLIENSISKAHLLVAISKLKAQNKNVDYFPAYEIFIDELRDYRFYGVDMVHPSEAGVEYIWERFSKHLINEKTQGQMKRVEGVMRDFNHRVKFPESESHKKFVEKCLLKANVLEKELKVVDFSYEKEKFL